ncbi:DNA topoisomerase 3 [Deltaproteobacteria bacterium TL4]
MSFKLCIAEKPSVAREIAGVVGAKQKKEGYFEGNGYWVTWTYGHLFQLKEPEDYSPAYKVWSLQQLPILPQSHGIKLINAPHIRKQFKIIQNLHAKASLIINCGDAGQEGELIQRWVLEALGNQIEVKRLWISSLTEEAIREGFQKMHDSREFDPLFWAGKARAISDWLLGMNGSRLYSKKFTDRGLLSIGRVQTPTLAMIVNRYEEIENFKPESYWELHTLYREVKFQFEKGKFENQETGSQVLAAIQNHVFVIQSITTRKGKEAPPRLYDLTTLQMEGNRLYSLTAENTLKHAQSLYEKKLISYPRVDTTYLPKDLYPKITGILKGLPDWSSQVAPLLEKPISQSSKVFNDVKVTDHHAIIPTGKSSATLSYDEQKVFYLICRRFIAAFYPDCEFSQTVIKASSAEHPFKATGKQILDPGWQILFEKEALPDVKKKEEETQILPNFVKGERGPHQPKLEEKRTHPPRPYTEATLLRAMETAGKELDDEALQVALKENGIGRPATRAAILETLFKREYIQRVKKALQPTVKGIELIHLIQNPILKSAELTGQWEQKLRAIENQKYTLEVFMKDMEQFLVTLVKEVVEAPMPPTTSPLSPGATASTAQAPLPPKDHLGVCPQCKVGWIIDKGKALGCQRWKEGCGFTLWKQKSNVTLNSKQLEALLQKGQTSVIKGFVSKQGKTFDAALKLDHEFKLVFDFNNTLSSPMEIQAMGSPQQTPASRQVFQTNPSLQLGDVCPQCKKGQIIQGKRAWGCNRWKEGCTFVITPELTAKEVR